jgi:hypothetical protein
MAHGHRAKILCEVRVACCDLAVLVQCNASLVSILVFPMGLDRGGPGLPTRELRNRAVKTVAKMGRRGDKKRRGWKGKSERKGKASLSLAHEHFTGYHCGSSNFFFSKNFGSGSMLPAFFSTTIKMY